MNVRLIAQNTARAGFTMIELVVVVLILAVLAGVAVPRFSDANEKAMDSRRVADLSQVEKALELYKADHGEYPRSSGNAWRGEAPSFGGLGHDENGYIPGLVPDYMAQLPTDPDKRYPTGNQGYIFRSNGTDYKFLAHRTPTDYPTDHRFFDPRRATWAYMVSSPGGRNW